MKTSKMKTIICSLAVVVSISSHAQGTNSGGGGDTVVDRKTGNIISIADPLAKQVIQGERFSLPRSVQDELAKISKVAEGYFFRKANFINLTGESTVDYQLVGELPPLDICQERITYKDVDGSTFQINPTACTSGKKTWIKKSDYEKLLSRDSKRELALLLVHEGLRRVPNLTSDDLVAITNGLRVVMAAYDSQIQGNMSPISASDRTTISTMLESILYAGSYVSGFTEISAMKSVLGAYKISEFGGLVAMSAQIHPSAQIGVGTIAINQMSVGANTVIVSSLFNDRYDLDLFRSTGEFKRLPIIIPQNVKIYNSQINMNNGASLSENATILNSTIEMNGEIGANALIQNSKLKFFGYKPFDTDVIGQNTKIINSTVELSGAGNNFQVNSSVILGSRLRDFSGGVTFANNVLIDNSQIIFNQEQFNFEVPNDVKLRNFNNASLTYDGAGANIIGLFSHGLFDVEVIEFVSGASLDLEGKFLCENGTSNQFKNRGGTVVRIKSKKDLAELCSQK